MAKGFMTAMSSSIALGFPTRKSTIIRKNKKNNQGEVCPKAPRDAGLFLWWIRKVQLELFGGRAEVVG